MRTLYGISLVALAMSLSACGDDDGSTCTNCGSDAGDAAVATSIDTASTNASDTNVSDTNASDTNASDTNATGSASDTNVVVTSGSGSMSMSTGTMDMDSGVSSDMGMDSGTPDTGMDASTGAMTSGMEADSGMTDMGSSSMGMDGGTTSDMMTDGGAGDGAVAMTACEAACANAVAAISCTDDSICATDFGLCSIRSLSANCVAEADAYLECLAQQPAEDFSCYNGTQAYGGSGCDLSAWYACYAG